MLEYGHRSILYCIQCGLLSRQAAGTYGNGLKVSGPAADLGWRVCVSRLCTEGQSRFNLGPHVHTKCVQSCDTSIY